jgi:hypothetical protein
MLAYALQTTLLRVVARDFRQQVLQVLVELYTSQAAPDHQAVCQCLFFLNDAQKVAEILNVLLQQDTEVCPGVLKRLRYDVMVLLLSSFVFRHGTKYNTCVAVPMQCSSPRIRP